MAREASREGFTIKNFGLANPRGPNQDSVPELLRRLASLIESMGDVEVYDLILHQQLDQCGDDSPSITVYYDTVDHS